jgi:Aminotransferase class-III
VPGQVNPIPDRNHSLTPYLGIKGAAERTPEECPMPSMRSRFDSIMVTAKRPPVVMVEGRGSFLKDEDGREYLDFVQGWAVNCLGHAPKVISDAVAAQAVGGVVFASGPSGALGVPRAAAQHRGGGWRRVLYPHFRLETTLLPPAFRYALSALARVRLHRRTALELCSGGWPAGPYRWTERFGLMFR